MKSDISDISQIKSSRERIIEHIVTIYRHTHILGVTFGD